jgi:hypothetical protein
MHPHRIALLLCLALTQACIFSESSVEPDPTSDMARDMTLIDMTPDLSGPDQDAPDLDVPDQDTPDQRVCLDANCATSCDRNVLTSCEVDANGCIVTSQSPCPLNTFCDAAANACAPNPCDDIQQVLCDPDRPNQYISCELNDDGLIVPRTLDCMDGTVCSTADESKICVPLECKAVGERSCVTTASQGICAEDEDNGRLYIQEEKCGDDEVCDGDRCKAHECAPDQLNTNRCTANFNGQEQCIQNGSGRRVWSTTITCGGGQACSASEQRCLPHECQLNQLNKQYCDMEENRTVISSCARDGGQRKRTVEQKCDAAQLCIVTPSGSVLCTP